jgi:hypothetical protein
MFKQAQQWKRHAQWGDVAERIVDDEGTKFHRQFVQDVAPVIDQNTRIRNETNGRVAGGRKLGSIPVTIVWDKIREWQSEGSLPPHGNPFFSSMLNEKLKDLLKDRDYSKFRTVDNV